MDLKRRNRFPFSSTQHLRFIDLDYLEIAKFEMVVVVVSEEYFTSMWSLMQLHDIMKARRSVKNENFKILPLFLGLNVDEFCNRQKGWFKVWEEMATSMGITSDEWKQSLNLILDSNGLVYNQDSKLEGLVSYRNEIISYICKVVPPGMNYLDKLHFQKRSKLCQVILFDGVSQGCHVSHS